MKKVIYLLLAAFLFSCETEITPNLPQSQALVAVDAWLYHKPAKQVIKVTTTNRYFDNSEPVAITGATVTVRDLTDPTKSYTFAEQPTGEYAWNPSNATDTFGIIGHRYALSIESNGRSYRSNSQLNRVTKIDSITWRFEKGDVRRKDSYLANFWARDLKGEGDVYWIKSWKNGKLLTKPTEINVSYDGAFSPGSDSDGLTFIKPIREEVNPFDTDDDDVLLNPFSLGDSIYVEINSVSKDAYYFLRQVKEQTDRPGGFGELFARPLANVQSNIFSNEPNEKVVGFFCISASNGLGRKFTQDAIFND